MKPDVSVVVSTYRRPHLIGELLHALTKQTLPSERFEVIAVDNCSGDNTSEVIEGMVTEVPYTLMPRRTDHNAGPAPARNLGWQAARADVVAFIDDDCTPHPQWLERGLSIMDQRPEVGVLQGTTRAPRDLAPFEHDDDYVTRIIEKPSPYFEACNMFYRRSALEAGGGFDESIGWWGEDSAAGWRAIESGWERAFAEDAIVEHPIERRDWSWHLRTGLLDENVVALAARHPGFRREAFWRPWAYRRNDAAFVGALAGLALAIRWRPAVVATLPYLWWRRPSMRRTSFFRLCVLIPMVDTARLVGRIRGSVRHRTLVL